MNEYFQQQIRRLEEHARERVHHIFDFNDSFKRSFESVHLQWGLTPSEKEEKAPTLADRTRWLIARCTLIKIIRKMRKLQFGKPLCGHFYTHLGEPIESIYQKFYFIWTQLLQGTAVLDDDNHWIDFWVLLDELEFHLTNINTNVEIDVH